MNILYGIQGTGHGHISRARAILPVLKQYAEVDTLVSGYNHRLPFGEKVTYRKRGISLRYSGAGKISIRKTLGSLHCQTFLRDVCSLDLAHYDLVISDFEPVTAWAARRSNIPCLGLSHQAALLSPNSPRPAQRSWLGELVLRRFAPCSKAMGFHFRRYDHFIEPPIIRNDIRDLNPVNGNRITVYLPAVDHELLMEYLKPLNQVRWQVFSPTCRQSYREGTVIVNPLDNNLFLTSMERSLGVLTGAGFETCAEALYLGKKLFVIPIRHQYEQKCNSAALQQMGATVARSVNEKLTARLHTWIYDGAYLSLSEITDLDYLVQQIITVGEQQPMYKTGRGTQETLLQSLSGF